MSTCHQYFKILVVCFIFPFSYKDFEIWCVFHTQSTSQFRLALSQVLSSHQLWLVVTILDHAGLKNEDVT